MLVLLTSEYPDKAHFKSSNKTVSQIGWFEDMCQTKSGGENTENASKPKYCEDWRFQIEGSNSQRFNPVSVLHSLKRYFVVFAPDTHFNFGGLVGIPPELYIAAFTLNWLPLLTVKIWLDSSLVLLSGSGAHASWLLVKYFSHSFNHRSPLLWIFFSKAQFHPII